MYKIVLLIKFIWDIFIKLHDIYIFKLKFIIILKSNQRFFIYILAINFI